MSLRSALAGGLALSALAAAPASALDFSFEGLFLTDNEVQLFDFTVGAPSTVTLRTYSYAGGVNAAGDVIPAGGFDPILALFDSSGALIGQNDDGAGVPNGPNTGTAYDTLLESSLAAGDYTVAVMQYDNFAAGSFLADGFTRDGQPNFTAGFGCSNGIFCDVSGAAPFDNRTGAWAFDVLNVAAADEGPTLNAAVPLPAALPLFAAALAGLGFAGRRRRG